jgi:Polyketide cyclase / dehydrase and lipid transport
MWYMVKIDVRVQTHAQPAALYALLRDGATWPTWSPIGSFELRQPAPDEPEGIGAIRVFHTGRATSVERIAELVPNRRFSYELEHGLPIKNYRADVDLITEGDVTTIHWHSTFQGKAPGVGLFFQLVLSRFIKQCAEGLAAYAALPVAGR